MDRYQYSIFPNAQVEPVLSQSWLNYFCRLVTEVASKSKDTSTKVGAIAIDPTSKRVLATGYNGFPAGVKEDSNRWERPTKYDFVVHAEANVIAAAAQFGISLKGAALFVSMHPCVECAKLIAASGIKHIYYIQEELKKEPSREWINHLDNAIAIFTEAGISMSAIDVCDGEWVTDNDIGPYDTLRSSPEHFCYQPYSDWVQQVTKGVVSTSKGKQILLILTDEHGEETTYITYKNKWREISKWQWYGFKLEPVIERSEPANPVTFRGNVPTYTALERLKCMSENDMYIVDDRLFPYIWNGVMWRVVSRGDHVK